MTDQILICMYLLREESRIECLVQAGMSFREVLHELNVKDAEHRLIAEKTSGLLCSPDVPLQKIGVQNCMKFLIY